MADESSPAGGRPQAVEAPLGLRRPRMTIRIYTIDTAGCEREVRRVTCARGPAWEVR